MNVMTHNDTMKSAARTPREFTPPGPGSWMLDATHCARPRSRWTNELFEESYAAGFRAGFERYGGLLETIEFRAVHGFPYLCVRPLGAPPDAKGTPPRFVFALLLRLHPALRKRVARAAKVLEEKTWRIDRDAFEGQRAEAEAKLRAFGSEAIEGYDDAALAEHLDRIRVAGLAIFEDHFRYAPSSMYPVGDFVAETMGWTGCSMAEALRALRGASPESVSTLSDLDPLVAALRQDPALLAEVVAAEDAGALLERLRSTDGAVGDAARAWLARHGDRIVGGHDLTEKRAIEIPAVLVASLRARLDGARREVSAEASSLRDRVPEQHRDSFDAALAEARSVYGLRDARMAIDWWWMGLARRAILEAGARLARRGALLDPEHAVDLEHRQLTTMLRGGKGPDPRAIAADAEWRRTATMADAPELLGPKPAPPPPHEWIPGPAGRLARAIGLYVSSLNEGPATKSAAGSVRGTAASAGIYVGTARIVRGTADFDKLKPGDVLVAPITTPTYNVILPLVGAIVTDRGGLLSHPAIVTREYGIPGVVGARGATQTIPDGARVEVDGGTGTVRVLG